MQDDALAASLLEHPAADGDDQAGLLGERDEVERRDRPARRVHPAEQRLDAVVGTLVEANDRLVVDLELVQLEGALQLGLELEPLDHALVHRRLEHAIAALAVALGHVHRDVGVPQQLLGVGRPELVPARQMPTLARG